MVPQDLQADLITSLKAGKLTRVETLRFLIAAVRNSAIAKYGSDAEKKLTEADIMDVVKKQVKTHRESIDAFTRAGRLELAQKESAQLEVLLGFLPKEMSNEELKTILAPVVAAGEKNFGLLMKSAMAAVKGQADGDEWRHFETDSMITVLFQTESHFPCNRKKIKDAVAAVLGGKVKRSVEVSVSIVGDRRMHQLNKQYRNIDDTTDVLSFGLNESAEKANRLWKHRTTYCA